MSSDIFFYFNFESSGSLRFLYALRITCKNRQLYLTTDQIKAIGEVTKNTSALSTENTLSSMEMFAQKQLFLLTKQDDVNNKRISADSFDSYHELGKKEKLGLANLIGISGDDLNKFVEKIQLFEFHQMSAQNKESYK